MSVDENLTGLEPDEVEELLSVLTRTVGEDDALRVLEDLVDNDFVIMSKAGLQRIVEATIEATLAESS